MLERARLNALQTFGKNDAIDGIIAPERLRADGFHCHAADGRGNFHIGVIFPVAGDGAGSRVEDEPVLVASLFGNDGVFAAGLQMLRRVVGILQRRGIGGQLIVRHIDRVIRRHHGEAPVTADEQGACALEADFLQVCAGTEGSVHNADAGWNGQAGQRVAVEEIVADVFKPVVQRDGGQAVHPADGSVLERAQRIGHGKRSNPVLPAGGV